MGQQEHHQRLQEQAAASSDEGVKQVLSTARGLREFLQSVEKLDVAELTLIVDQAIAMLEGFVDVFVDGRSRPSEDVVNDALAFDVQAGPASRIELRGYRGTGELVCARRASLA